MIAVFHGKDDFRANEALAALRQELDSDGLLADNTVRVDGASAKPDELLALCQTMPFLGGRRLVIVRGLLGRFEVARPRRGRQKKQGKQQDEELQKWESFVEGLRALPESTALVFLDSALTKQNPLLSALTPLAQVREFPSLKQQGEVAGWITQRAVRYGASLEPRAVAVLAGLVGNELWTLDSELQKLALYADGRPVTEDDVRSLVSQARETNVFAMFDAVIEGRERDAAGLLQRLLAESEPPQRLLTLLVRQYRMLVQTKELHARGVRPTEMEARLGVRDFAVRRLLQQAPGYTIDRLRRAYRRILEADLSVKRGVYDEETAFQLLLFDLVALARRQAAGPTRPAGRRGYSRPPGGRGRPPPGAAMASSGRR